MAAIERYRDERDGSSLTHERDGSSLTHEGDGLPELVEDGGVHVEPDARLQALRRYEPRVDPVETQEHLRRQLLKREVD